MNNYAGLDSYQNVLSYQTTHVLLNAKAFYRPVTPIEEEKHLFERFSRQSRQHPILADLPRGRNPIRKSTESEEHPANRYQISSCERQDIHHIQLQCKYLAQRCTRGQI